MNKKIVRSVLSIFAVLTLCSCGANNSESSPGDSSESSSEPIPPENFTLKKVETYYYSKYNVINVNAFYRKDKLTNIPHISLKNYYNLLTKKEMSVEKTSEDTYKVTSANGEVAIIDTNTDKLDVDDYQNFISTTIYRQEGVSNYYFDGAPFLKVKDISYSKKAKHKTIDFSKYGIDLVGTEDDIILPFATASNIFTGATMITSFCTKDHFYFIDPNDSSYETSHYYTDSTVQSEFLKSFKDNKRSEEEALFSYGELCFLIDTYYGLPGREYLHDALNESRDLDATLGSFNLTTRQARAFLKSTDLVEYLAGIEMLDAFLYDAGHTVISVEEQVIASNNRNLQSQIQNKLNAINFDRDKIRAKSNWDGIYIRSLMDSYYSANIENNSYKKFGDTLVYRFNSFMFDINGWHAHYASPTQNPIPNDEISTFKKMLDQYENDSSIKNVVLDISLNGGGFGDMVAMMMGLMTGKAEHNVYDTTNENYVKTTFDFDANFDGKFDDKDKEVKYHYKFAILSSAYSFSCGNLLPAEAKDAGIVLFGDKSGGGSCAVVDSTTSEGLYVRLSCPNHFVSASHQEVELGVEPHYKLVKQMGYDYDFSDMYNFTNISQKMHEFYEG